MISKFKKSISSICTTVFTITTLLTLTPTYANASSVTTSSSVKIGTFYTNSYYDKKGDYFDLYYDVKTKKCEAKINSSNNVVKIGSDELSLNTVEFKDKFNDKISSFKKGDGIGYNYSIWIYENNRKDYGENARILIDDFNNLDQILFNNRASSILVLENSGKSKPEIRRSKIARLWADTNYKGSSLIVYSDGSISKSYVDSGRKEAITLVPDLRHHLIISGYNNMYSDLKLVGMENKISSIQIFEEGYSLKLYDENYFRDNGNIIKKSTKNLGSLSNTIESFQIVKPLLTKKPTSK